jgi:cytochrome oxidase Cu insertion factor (SCO1/SenC/PrrC family)
MLHPGGIHKLVRVVFIASSALVIITGTLWGIRHLTVLHNQATAQQTNNTMAIGGFPLKGDPAPDFTLTNQFGQSVTLSSLRGHEIVMAFIDSQCKTLCPLTAQIMYDAKARLGSSATSQVMLIAVNANPAATSIAEVQAWSINHGMLHQWLFLTGTALQLQSIYHLYNVYDQVTDGQAVHDPVIFIIDAKGREQLYFETLSSNSQSDLNSQINGLVAGMQQWLPKS